MDATKTLLLLGGVGVVAWLATGRMTFKVYEQQGGSYTFAVFRRDSVIYADAGPYANAVDAGAAAALWISTHPRGE